MVEIEDRGLQVGKRGAGEGSAPPCRIPIGRNLTTGRAARAQGNRYQPDHGQFTAREQPRREEIGAYEAGEFYDAC